MSDSFQFFEPENDADIPREWEEYPPCDNDPDLDDLKAIMRPRELDYWSRGGQSHAERQAFLARIDARWRRWKDIARRRKYGPTGEPDRAAVDQQMQKVMAELRSRRAARPTSAGVDLKGLQDAVERASQVMEEAAKILRRRDPKQQPAAPDKKPLDVNTLTPRVRRFVEEQKSQGRELKSEEEIHAAALQRLREQLDRSDRILDGSLTADPQKSAIREHEQQASWAKVIGGVVLAFLGFYFLTASAFQNAGVQSVWVAHSMIAAGWLVFMLSISFADYYLPLPKRAKVKVLILVGAVSLLFAIGADLVMVRLKAQQQQPLEAPSGSTAAPASSASTPAPNTEQRALLDVAPEKLLDFFEKYNEAQAEDLVRPYMGAWVELSGVVTGVRREPLLPQEGERALRYGVEVTFRGQRADRPKTKLVHRALFEEQRWMDRAMVLKPNDEHIKVRGKIKYVFFYGFYLEHCEIIE